MNPIQMLPRHEAEELMLLQRRIRYLSTKYDTSDEAYIVLANLRDVATSQVFIEQISKL
jgi:hypothetical protein